MSEFKVSVADQVMKIQEAPIIASGGINEVKVVFSFCEKWDGFIKTALFYRDTDNIYYAVLDDNDTCILPWEVYAEDGTFYFSVIGEREDTRRTSTVVRYKVGKGVVNEEMMPSDPTPEVYDQIIAIVNENKAVTEAFITDMEEKVESGYFDGKDGVDGKYGVDGYTPVRGTDYWTTEDQKEIYDKCCTAFAESGSVVVCDPVEDYPLSVVTHIVPAQAGKGDPSPDNVRPIKGFSGVKLWRGGKNLLPYPYTNTTNTNRGVTFTDNGDGSITANGTTTENPIFILNTNYLGGNAAINSMSHPNGSTNGTYAASYHLYYNAGNGILSINLTPGTYANEIIWPQIEAGSVSTEYEPYRGKDFVVDIGQTVYGGSFDWKTGVLTVDKKCAFYDGSADEEWTLATGGYDASFVRIASDSNNHDNAYTSVICNRLTANSPNVFYGQGTGIYMYNKWVSIRVDTIEQSVEAYRAWLAENPLEVIYPIDPITIQLAPQEVLALSGRNTLYSNAGDTTVTGRADPTTVIEKLTNAIIALGGNV